MKELSGKILQTFSEHLIEKFSEEIDENVDSFTGEPCDNPCVDCMNNTWGKAIWIVRESLKEIMGE